MTESAPDTVLQQTLTPELVPEEATHTPTHESSPPVVEPGTTKSHADEAPAKHMVEHSNEISSGTTSEQDVARMVDAEAMRQQLWKALGVLEDHRAMHHHTAATTSTSKCIRKQPSGGPMRQKQL